MYIYIYRKIYLNKHVYIYIYIYGHPPRSIPASSTRFHRLLLYVGPLLTFAENTVNTDRIVHFAMCMQTVLLQVAGLIRV